MRLIVSSQNKRNFWRNAWTFPPSRSPSAIVWSSPTLDRWSTQYRHAYRRCCGMFSSSWLSGISEASVPGATRLQISWRSSSDMRWRQRLNTSWCIAPSSTWKGSCLDRFWSRMKSRNDKWTRPTGEISSWGMLRMEWSHFSNESKVSLGRSRMCSRHEIGRGSKKTAIKPRSLPISA